MANFLKFFKESANFQMEDFPEKWEKAVDSSEENRKNSSSNARFCCKRDFRW